MFHILFLHFCSDYFAVSTDEDQCEPYRGTMCSPHFGNSPVYVEAGQTQASVEAALQSAMLQISELLPNLSERCTKYLRPSMCLTAFPLCRDTPRLVIHRMCYDECSLLTTDICTSLFEYVDSQPELGLVDMLPICTDLPLTGSNRENTCINMGMSQTGGNSYFLKATR